MTAPENIRERLAEALTYLPVKWHGDRPIGFMLDNESAEFVADALLPLIDTLLAEQGEGIAAEALERAAKDARERGDIGTDDGPTVWDWLVRRAAHARWYGGER